MGAVIVQGPQDPVVTVDYVRKFLHVDTLADNDRIEALTAAATARLDGPEGILGRALRQQTLRISLPSWPASGYKLPFPPLIAITGITYLDGAGVEQAFASSNYRVLDGGLQPSCLIYADGVTLPAVLDLQPDSVRITFDAGYQDLNSPANNAVPEPIKQAIVMMVQSWFDIGITEDIPEVVNTLVSPYKVRRLGSGY